MSAARKEALERMGIKLRFTDRYEVIISNTNIGIGKALRDSPWEKNWGRTLKRIGGAETIKSYRFFSRHSRATMLPMDVIMGDGEGEDGA